MENKELEALNTNLVENEVELEQPQDQEQTLKRNYSSKEEMILKNADILFNLTNDLIMKTHDALLDVWDIDKDIDKSNMQNNPMGRLIEMFEWYVDQWKKKHASYLAKNHLKLTNEDKEKLEEIDKNKPAEVVACKQIKEIKLG